MAIRSTILIARINRAIETGGAIGDGAKLAQLYAEAVNAANVRLDAVVAAIEAKQISDAVRVMEDEPRLLDEVGALDFQRLPDWEVVCERNGWTMPPKLDQSQIERVLMLNEDAAATESFLRMYRKAVRANDQRLAIQSLRHLVKADSSQNWKGNLVQAEKALQTQMANAFEAAHVKEDVETAERLAREFLSEPWSEPPSSKAALAIRSYVDGLDAAARDREGGENVDILRKCLNGDWNLDLAFSMIQAIDRLVETGWTIPKDAQSTVDDCRRRCGEEMEVKEFEARWHTLCGELHTAVQKEDCEAIRNVLSAPEFLDKEPEEELLRSAQLVIEHEEAARRRKMVQITVCVVMGIVAVLGLSAWLYKNKLFNDRCEDVAGKLAALEKEANIERMAAELERLKGEERGVYADGRVGIFAGKLDKLVADNAARTNEIVSILGELERLMEGEWKDATMAATGRIERAKSLVKPSDIAYNKRLLAIRSSWQDHVDADETSKRELAGKFSELLVAELRQAAALLNGRLADAETDAAVKGAEEKMEKWRKLYAADAPDLDASVADAERGFEEARKKQEDFQSAITRLKDAKDAAGILDCRAALVENYGGYKEVGALKPLPFSNEDALALLNGTSKGMENYVKRLNSGVTEEEFKAFVEEQLIAYKDFPSYYSLYGVYAKCKHGLKEYPNTLLAICREKPEIGRSASYKDSFQISGDLIDFTQNHQGESKSDMECPNGTVDGRKVSTENPVAVLLPPSDEIRVLVDLGSRTDLTIGIFENEILKLVDAHLGAARQNAYHIHETSDQSTFVERGGFPAARRVQLLKQYVDWLHDELKLMPELPEMKQCLQRLTALSQTVKVDGVPDELTWTCLFDSRVRTRNKECAEYLAKFPTNFVARYKSARYAQKAMESIAHMKVESAGKVDFDPFSALFKKDANAILPTGIPPDVQRDHPLYVLRKNGEALLLKKALVPGKKFWALASTEIKDELLLGEPLFQISFRRKYVDMEAEIAAIAKAVPNDGARQYLPLIPYFNISAK